MKIPKLASKDIALWVLNCHKIPSEVLQEYWKLLSISEKERYNNFYLERDKHNFLVGRGVLRSALSKYINKLPTEIVFRHNSNGKPLLNETDDYYFSVSHSNNYVAVAIARSREVGVDIEFLKYDLITLTGNLNIAKRFFASIEYEDLVGIPIDKQNSHFCMLWTLKESYIKALGAGLTKPLCELVFKFEEDGTFSFFDTNKTCGLKNWDFFVFHLGISCCLAISYSRENYHSKLFYSIDNNNFNEIPLINKVNSSSILSTTD